jgi:DNA mismatch repair ATPase MutS
MITVPTFTICPKHQNILKMSMEIYHVTVETLKKVEHVSTAKIMDISLTGALRNVMTDMKRRLSRDIISKPMLKKHLDQMEKNFKG